MTALVFAACLILTVGSYLATRAIFLRFRHALLNPVFLSTLVIIAVLKATGGTLADYQPAKEVMTFLLGPATVALALPLYHNRAVLQSQALPVLAGVLTGSLATIAAVLAAGRLAGLSRGILVSLGPKSVTVPIAVEISRLAGGEPTLTAAFVVATGMIGSILGPLLLTAARVQDPVARGLALGTVSHGQGTAVALLEGERAGAMGDVAMAIAAVFTALIAPYYLPLLLP